MVTHVIGNRPHFMKLAPIVTALRERGVTSTVLNTSQHWDDSMSGQFAREFGITIDHSFTPPTGGHGVQTGGMMISLEQHWAASDALPPVVLVYGDTNSTLAAALVAAKLDIPVGHVEGGLRADFLDTAMPEEINRKLVDDLSRWIYTPTDRCAETLRRENFSEDRIVNCGDVMFDRTLATVAGPAAVVERARPFIFVTVHRAENTNDRTRLFSIFDALLRLAAQIDVVVAIHPRTEKVLAESDRMDGYRRKIEFLPPLGHVETLRMVQAAKLVVSDSGGLPKEAAFLGKRSVLLRRQAVWTELVDQGYAALADPAVPDAIEKAVERLIEAGETREPIRGFGDGRAAAAIAEHIVAQLGVHR